MNILSKIKAMLRLINAVNELVRAFWEAPALRFSGQILRNFGIIYETSRRHVPEDRCLKIYSDKILKQKVQKCLSPNVAPNICGPSIWVVLHAAFLTHRCLRCILRFRK